MGEDILRSNSFGDVYDDKEVSNTPIKETVYTQEEINECLFYIRWLMTLTDDMLNEELLASKFRPEILLHVIEHYKDQLGDVIISKIRGYLYEIID